MIYLMKDRMEPEQQELVCRMLPAWKQEKLDRIRNERARTQSICAWALLFYGLRTRYGRESWPPLTEGPHGKPEFCSKEGEQPLHFSLSHTEGAVMCVLTDRPVGADIQKIPPYRERTVRYYASEQEYRILQERENPTMEAALLWTMKEAYLKYLGTGISSRLPDLDFSGVLLSGKVSESAGLSFYGLHFQTGAWGDGLYTVCGLEEEEAPLVLEEESIMGVFRSCPAILR